MFKFKHNFIRILLKYGIRNYGKTASLDETQRKSILITPDCFAAFQNSLPRILDKIVEERFTGEPETEIVNYIKYISEQNLRKGKQKVAEITLHVHKTIQKEMTEDNIYRMHVMAWATEIVNSYSALLMSPKNTQSDEASLLRSLLYQMLAQEFKDTPVYNDILDIFNQAFIHTAFGHHIENTISRNKNYDSFTMQNYNTLVKHKSSYTSIKLPVFLAMIISGKINEDFVPRLDEMCFSIGRMLQIQSDYLDCYSSTDVPAMKDIQAGRCSWLSVSALHHCSSAQRRVFTTCYGSDEPAHYERIKFIYDKLQLPRMYQNELDLSYSEVVRKAHALSCVSGLPLNFFLDISEMIYNGDR